jgi:NADH dehydrogenase [ubiquinone] 1 alpha subcomplex assembly factor 1
MKRTLIATLLVCLMMTTASAASLFEFNTVSSNWFVRNDGVMGGISSSRFSIGNGTLKFSGRIRLENDGGFAGIRSYPTPSNLSGFKGISIRVRGDGKRYAIQLVTSSAPRVTYRAVFATSATQWREVFVPFTAFRPTRSGNLLRGPALNTRSIERYGLTVGNGRAENFSCEVDWIRAY